MYNLLVYISICFNLWTVHILNIYILKTRNKGFSSIPGIIKILKSLEVNTGQSGQKLVIIFTFFLGQITPSPSRG